ncbi:hypothetical protein [Paenibacillus sp. ISL-20]|uniref:hypothetical protein n=1 Tax=Paenibacillus sp. ISL-20 TaxID=2819163 RepID=UPI001BE84775|nr:hypothetical protein [Paenibacillus sp. ISL-20]MBT2759872.1 hypothetical protein [Paenibacillus sp. ISL-20]
MLLTVEDENNIFVKCRMCGKLGAVERAECTEFATGYKLNRDIQCRCGHIASEIIVHGKEKIDFSDISYEPEVKSQEPELIKCVKCKSTQLTAGDKGFGLGKAAIGGLALGPVGLLSGVIGSKKTMITCLNCGHKWEAGKK